MIRNAFIFTERKSYLLQFTKPCSLFSPKAPCRKSTLYHRSCQDVCLSDQFDSESPVRLMPIDIFPPMGMSKRQPQQEQEGDLLGHLTKTSVRAHLLVLSPVSTFISTAPSESQSQACWYLVKKVPATESLDRAADWFAGSFAGLQ